MKKLNFRHALKNDIRRSMALLPIFLLAAYMGMAKQDYFLAMSSAVVWLLIVLFASQYWIQAIICLIGSLIALYSDVVWLTLILWLLFLYLILAANSARQEKLKLFRTDGIEDGESDVHAIFAFMTSFRERTVVGASILIVLVILMVIVYLLPKIWSFISKL